MLLQPFAGDRIGEPRPQHHECVLPLVHRRARGSSYRVIQTPQRAARARIQIAHAADYDMRLVIQIQAVANQLIEIDLG